MTDLEKQAEELGIKVDGRWSEDRLQEEIDKALAAPKQEAAKPAAKKQAPAKIPVRLTYDVWFEADKRTVAGTVVEVSLNEALDLISNGKAVRADPLPGT